MTSKISLVKLTTQKFSQNIWLFALLLIAMFFSSPLILFMEISDVMLSADGLSNTLLGISTGAFDYISEYITYNPILPSIAIVAGLLMPIVLFRYINSKSEVDFYHSLPIRREKLFLTNYLLGIFIFTISLAIITAISVSAFATVSTLDRVFLIDLCKFTLHIVLHFVAIYSITTFAVIITGNVFMAGATSFGFMFLFSSVYYVLSETFNLLLKNFHFDYTILQKVSSYTNPLVSIYNDDFASIIFSISIIILIYSALAFVMYKKRWSENASNAVAINFLKPVIKFIGVFGATLLGGFVFCQTTNDSILWFIIGSILVGTIIHCAFEIIYEGDFKALFVNFKHLIIYFVIVFASFSVINFDIMGFDDKLPKLEDIESVDVLFGYYNEDDVISLKDPQNIEKAYELAKYSIENNNIQDSNESFYISYTLKNGKTMKRFYNDTIIKSHNPEVYYSLVLDDEFKNDVYSFDEINYDELLPYHSSDYTIFEDQLQVILETLEEEIKNLPYDYLRYNLPIKILNVDFSESGSTYRDYNSYYDKTFYVYDACTKTKELLENYRPIQTMNDSDEIYMSMQDQHGRRNQVVISNPDDISTIIENTILTWPSNSSNYRDYIDYNEVIIITSYDETGESAFGYIQTKNNPEIYDLYLKNLS